VRAAGKRRTFRTRPVSGRWMRPKLPPPQGE
jgi:hypothetical protein